MKSRIGVGGLVACFVGLAMSGCAHQNHDVASVQTMLAASGFQMKLADTPEKLANVQSYPQRKIFPVQREGQLKYVWADAKDCKCMYTGDEANYQSFARLAEQEKIARENYEAARAAEEWGAWQPGWGPEWWWW
jgi:hypothetical protein